MNPRISVNAACFPKNSIAEDIAAWKALGSQTVTVHTRKLNAEGWDAGVSLLKGSGLDCAAMVQSTRIALDQATAWESEQEAFRRSVDAAKELGSKYIYTTSGNRSRLEWNDAAKAYCSLMRPAVDYARSQGIGLLLEPTVSLHADISLVHTLRDTVRLAEQAGLGICLDIFHCWTDADLKESIGRAVPNCGLVQVSDYVMGDKSLPARAVPCDGSIPLDRILGWIRDAGYKGVFDLELNGPRIDAEGQMEAVARAAQWLEDFLIA